MGRFQYNRTNRKRNINDQSFKNHCKLMRTTRGNRRPSIKDLARPVDRRRNESNTFPTIFSLPNELITDVLARVAVRSFHGFFDVKLSCKVFHQIADDKYILQHVSLDKLPVNPWHQSTRQKQDLFLEKCKKSGHPEALYRDGVVKYFSLIKVEEGLSCLSSASKVGHLGASYVLGVILLCTEEPDQEEEGRRLLSHVRSEKGIKESRNKLKDITSSIWRNNLLKPKPNYCPMQDQHRARQGWPSDKVDDMNCEACSFHLEVTFVCNLLRGNSTG